MKITERNTNLDFLTVDMLPDFQVLQESWHLSRRINFKENLRRSFPYYQQFFNKKVQYITVPFLEAYVKNRDKINELLVTEEVEPASGTFLFKINSSLTKTIFYSIEMNEAKTHLDITLFEFQKDTSTGLTTLLAALNCKDTIIANDKIVLGDNYNQGGTISYFISDGYGTMRELSGTSMMIEILGFVFFLQHCDLEVKIVNAGSKAKVADVKYVNDSKSGIEIVDSTWFTTIVRDEEFLVTHHFRRQYYGPGKSKWKWIYIRDYKKYGYVRQAKILRQK